MPSAAMLSISAIALMLSSVSAVRHTPITLVSQSAGVRENNSDFNPNTFRDGGVSTFVNGFHLQLFQDSKTCRIPDFNDPSCAPYGANFTSGVRNSIGYFGYLNASDPADVYTIAASTAPAGHQVFRIYDYASGYFPLASGDGPSTYIWPNYAVPLPDNKTALVSAYVNNGDTAYTSLFTVDVVAPSEIPVGKSLNITRVPGVATGLSFPGAPQYCGQMMVNVAQTELFCFATHGDVINMARVPIAEYGNLSAYHFYNASSGTYSQHAPPNADHSVAIISSPSGLGWASFYYSEYHETYVALIQATGNQVLVTYSTTGEPAGPWTTPTHLFDAYVDPACFTYHFKNSTASYYVNAHQAWYGTEGNKLLVGWSGCTAYYNMSTIEFS